ncbi:hypothetical protein, partial [Treponema berlinense]|uniref:hypothetical protein n=1 Tax=Treponema berlinense TaxID=225004 RepID=UPI003FD7AD72
LKIYIFYSVCQVFYIKTILEAINKKEKLWYIITVNPKELKKHITLFSSGQNNVMPTPAMCRRIFEKEFIWQKEEALVL